MFLLVDKFIQTFLKRKYTAKEEKSREGGKGGKGRREIIKNSTETTMNCNSNSEVRYIVLNH